MESYVRGILDDQPTIDVHTHLYPPAFGTPVDNASGRADPQGLMLWGIDELLTYHYLVAEVFRVVPADELPYERFWALTKREQADHIWSHLFEERTPMSEACRGVITTLNRLEFDPRSESLGSIRTWFAEQDPNSYIDRVLQLANVEKIVMTNAVFDDNERARWLSNPGIGSDSRFSAVLRIDPLLVDWPDACQKLREWGYDAEPALWGKAREEARRFLRDWLDRMRAIYIAASLRPEFRYPDGPSRAVLDGVILPVCEERGIPLALMIGSRRAVNPELRDAGDASGKADALSVAKLCAAFPRNRFLVTMLSREDQHELAVVARKFGNLMPFGCWWFLNNSSLVEEITRMRMELLGTSFIPQHSDARVLDQLVYKWDHSKRIIARVLTDRYDDLAAAGWKSGPRDIANDARMLMKDNFLTFARPGGDNQRTE